MKSLIKNHISKMNTLILLCIIFIIFVGNAIADYSIIKYNQDGVILFKEHRERDPQLFLINMQDDILSVIEYQSGTDYLVQYDGNLNLISELETLINTFDIESYGSQLLCLVGYFQPYPDDQYSNYYKIHEMRVECYDFYGNLIWDDNSVGDLPEDLESYTYSASEVKFDNHGQMYILGGRTYNYNIDKRDWAIVLWKYSNTGELLWMQEYEVKDYDSFIDMFCMRDDSIILITQNYIIKFDECGEIVWEKEIEDKLFMDDKIVKDKYDNMYILNEPTWGEVGVCKVNADGEFLWREVYSNEMSLYSNDIEIAPDGGVVISADASDRGMALVKYSSEGVLIWDTEMFNDEYEDNYHAPCDMIIDKYGIIYLWAYYCTWDPGEGCREGRTLMMKFNSSGQLMWQKKYNSSNQAGFLPTNGDEAVYFAYGNGLALSSSLQQEDDSDYIPYPTADDDDDSGCGC